MPRDVNVYITNYRATGSNVSVPQLAVDISANWKKDDNTTGTASQTVLFPNVLNQLTAAQQKELLTDLLIRALRLIVGVDS